MMELKEYFENIKGFGVLSTADNEGNVNAAVYSRPHFMEDGSLAFIMWDRLTHKNIQNNPKAIYLFREDSPGYKGRRIYLEMIREEENDELIHQLRRRMSSSDKEQGESRFLVYFKVEKVIPLIGPGE